MKRPALRLAPLFRLALGLGAALGASGLTAADAEPRWFKGNLHTHSLWSDGDDYPEMIADWFKREGWHFLAMSEHNVLEEGTCWLELKPPAVVKGEVMQKGGGAALEKYLRLKPLAEYRSLLEEPGRFLMIPGAEITSAWKRAKTDTTPEMGGPVHLNVTNPRDLVAKVEADNALEIMQRTVDAVLAQRAKTGQPMLLHLNHPNFVWGVTAEELMQVVGEQFFEVYNGHPGVHNDGDATRLGTDDSHAYHTMILGKSNPGRGWVMVRARHLTAESIIAAMEAGDFYASSGVTLADVQRGGNSLAVEIKAEPGVTYVTKFIGTRRGYDPTSQLIPPANEAAKKTLPHRRYSKDVGAVLAEVTGPRASYTLKGDELYVRAKIISSKPKPNASVANEVECAWTQPLMGGAK
jgi:hypothetical protein